MYRLFLVILLASIGINLQASDFSKAFKKVDPAVVVITTEEAVKVTSETGLKNISRDGLGSGVIISRDGLIMTAAHVVSAADKVTVTLKDGRQFIAKVITVSNPADVALIGLVEPPDDLVYIEPGNSDNIEIGNQVFVIGSPYGLSHTLTTGHLSSRRIIDDERALMDMEFLQTDAAVNQGNSGGPLFSQDGKLVGIVSHIRTVSGGNEGLGFAASINMARKLLLEDTPFWLGAQFIPLNEQLSSAFNVPYNEGLLVQKVTRGSIAEELGIRPGTIPIGTGEGQILIGGDIIVEIGGHNVYVTRAGRQRIIDYIASVAPGDDLIVTVIRAGKKLTLKAPKH